MGITIIYCISEHTIIVFIICLIHNLFLVGGHSNTSEASMVSIWSHKQTVTETFAHAFVPAILKWIHFSKDLMSSLSTQLTKHWLQKHRGAGQESCTGMSNMDLQPWIKMDTSAPNVFSAFKSSQTSPKSNNTWIKNIQWRPKSQQTILS